MNNGILIIDKPVGLTSHDVVSRLRRILNTKKIGHTGTLDPFATGVLVMLVGKATRLAQFLDKDAKSYEAIIRFGFETDTGDRTGTPREVNYELGDISVEKIEEVLPEFTGEIKQIPPMYSAKKVKGKKLYEMARQGIEIERKPVNVKISELQIANYGLPKNEYAQTQDIGLFVTCSAGTYIRTLAEDIGRKIGVPCHLAELRRTQAGKFGIENAVSLEELEKIVENGKLNEILISMNDAVSHLPEKKLEKHELKLIQNGMKINGFFEDENVQQIRLNDPENNLVAIGNYDKSKEEIQPRMVFTN
ncbi:MAG: tRNA pseudouridine(55) synthase TruB [Acidobacteriota bacterium]|jgi:tRNA pseudouridine55 synthase|nr:tRNA pseudouridine(55) synthase TruB [Acidobacteriota bacterium]